MDGEWICECERYDIHGSLGCDRPTSRGMDSSLCTECERDNCEGRWRPTPMGPQEFGWAGPIKRSGSDD